jgi:hypothetical protein
MIETLCMLQLTVLQYFRLVVLSATVLKWKSNQIQKENV